MKQELPPNIKEKLAEIVEIWADENLVGRPAILANMMYCNLERTMLESIEKMDELFPLKEKQIV